MDVKKIVSKFGIDFGIWTIATPIAYFLRLEQNLSGHLDSILIITCIFLPIKVLIIYYEKFYLQSWHRMAYRDLQSIIRGVSIYLIIIFGIALLVRDQLFIPLSEPFIEAMFLILGTGITRFVARLSYEYKDCWFTKYSQIPKNVLIVGAGDAGTMIARELFRHTEQNMKPIGFLDDDPKKKRQRFLGLNVLGKTTGVSEVIREYNVDILLIAMPSVKGEVSRRIIKKAYNSKKDIECKIIPTLRDLVSGKVTVGQIRDVNVEDLLRREPIKLNTTEIADYMTGKVVLVTGAGGSIGSEIVRQIVPFKPQKLLLADKGEYRMYNIEQELSSKKLPFFWKPIIADIKYWQSVADIFQLYHPDVIFHAAAHKHVPLMEENPAEAIRNNVGGTKNLVEWALKSGVSHFVNISTDKAVNPTSIMGASKRIAEYIVENAGQKASTDQTFASVRFGNVLGSSGSVVPKFKKQIENREAVTVTHPDMTRYFMTIPEASQLVLQAGGIKGSEMMYVLDMGDPVKIMDLAKDLIHLSGLEPDIDIPIKITGIRPGEKLYEELLTSEESNTSSTRYSKIYAAKQNGLPLHFENQLEKLLNYVSSNNEIGIKMTLNDLIPINELKKVQESPSLPEAAQNLSEAQA